eukprot:5979890-Pyramimonas_sp.AAC.1
MEPLGHAFVECPALTQRLLDDAEERGLDPQLATARGAMLGHGPVGEGRQDTDSFAVGVGIPRWPRVVVPPPPEDPPSFLWGDWTSPSEGWSERVCTDGSGYHGDVPELRRCGWAAAMIDASGVPVRAARGGLAGGQQAAGKAERVAVPKALQHL